MNLLSLNTSSEPYWLRTAISRTGSTSLEKKMSAREMVEKAVNSKIGKFTKNDIAELCPEISKGSVEQTLKKLCDEGKIKKEGVGKATFYHIV